jgi:Fungal Zn(2)-Cys(6) binuclear cluster domain/Aflatoxin regulatory protein
MKTVKAVNAMNLDPVSPTSLPSPSSDSAEPIPPPSRSATQSLRDSCDSCYKAKIKCSKTKPECERCMNRGFRCVYLPSRRRGRTKAMTERCTPHDSPTRSQRDATDCTSQHGSIIPSGDLDLLKNLPDFSSFTIPDFSGLDTLHETSSPIDLFASSESAQNLFSEPDINMSQDFFGTTLNMPALTPSAAASLGLCTPPTSAYATPDGKKQTTLSSESFMAHLDSLQCDCLSQCLEALNMLYKPSTLWGSPPAFDVIMTINSWATNQCSTTLNCMRCFSREGNSSLAMLLGTLLTKILAHYQVAILGTSVPRENHPMRLMLGTFPVDVGAEQRLKLDILRPELQKLQPLLGRFSDLCERVRDENSGGLFQRLPEDLENDFHNMTRLFQQQRQKVAGHGFGSQTIQ